MPISGPPTPICSLCHGPNDRAPQRYCRKCHNAYARENRFVWDYKQKEDRGKELKAKELTKAAVRKGWVKKGPCALCGTLPSEAYRPDPSKPTRVIWLCRRHRCEALVRRRRQVKVLFCHLLSLQKLSYRKGSVFIAGS